MTKPLRLTHPGITLIMGLSFIPVLMSGAGPAGPPSRYDPLFLLKEGKLTESELRALKRGRIVTKVMDSNDPSEVLSFAAMRVKTTPSRVLERFRAVGDGGRDPWVLAAGRLGVSPAPSDLEGLTLDPGDVEDLSECRVNRCDVRLPAEVIELFRLGIGWSSPDRAAEATALFRRTLASYALSYRRRGNAALFQYDNNDVPVRIWDGLEGIIARSRFFKDANPELYAYLDRFPDGQPAGAEDFIYWQKEKFWRMNVLSLNHATVMDRETAAGRSIVVVSKQLYASHYYETALNVSAYAQGPAGYSYLVSLKRARADVRPTGFNWLERLLLNRLVRGRIAAEFSYVKQQLEGV